MCGIFGVWGKDNDAARHTYFGLYALQHRGQESAGISVANGNKIHTYKEQGLVSQIFREETLKNLPGNLAIGHTRYSTTGHSVVTNAQPINVEFKGEQIAVAHNGNIVNADALRIQLKNEGFKFSTTSDTEIIAALISTQKSDNLMDAMISASEKISGAYSLLVLTKNSVIGMRDPYGVRPLALGQQNGNYLFSSEDCAFNIIGGNRLRDVMPGEIVRIDDSGIQSKLYFDREVKAICAFEFIYLARPDSTINNRNLYHARVKMGSELFKQHPVKADIVIGVPDSGTPAAIGYAKESGIPYEDAIIKNRYVGRTFITPDQKMREQAVRVKLNPIEDVIRDKKVVVVDDSIVRGTTSKKIVKILREAGADEVHMRVSSPPVINPCFYGIDTAKKAELIGSTMSVDEISTHLNVDSLGYLSIEGMLRAIHLRDKQLCLACLNGDYPIEVPEDMQRLKLLFE
jgi:amidophosphoribosyltransferase